MNEVEPRVDADSVAKVLRRQINVYGYSPDSIIERAGVSIDKFRRVLQGRWETLSLDEADRLLVGAGSHISEVELVWPEGAGKARKPGSL